MEASQPLVDPGFGLQMPGIRLQRIVEVYQNIKTRINLPRGDVDFSVSKGWTDRKLND